MAKIEVIPVNKFQSAWAPETLYNGFMIRAVLKQHDSLIKTIMSASDLRTRLVDQYQYNDIWLLIDNPYTNSYELYLKNISTLVLWKLQDHEHFSTLFDRVEQHKGDLKLDEL